jgi:hypothetical protein
MSSSSPSADLAARWRGVVLDVLREVEVAGPLKEAALAGKLGEWTRHLTGVIVQTCRALDWCAAAKGFPLDMLPQAGQEYLGMDVMAFALPSPRQGRCWRFPVAVFELENSRDDDRVAYSLWKVLCIRSDLRAVFAYRDDWELVRGLVSRLAADLLNAIPQEQRGTLGGQTLLITGSRGEGETFPWGYFKVWELNPALGRFEKV